MIRRTLEMTNVALDAMLGQLDGGVLLIYDGEPPAAPDAPVEARVLAALQLNRPAFVPAFAGQADANPIAPAIASSSGVARWWQVRRADEVPAFDGPIADLHLTTTQINRGAEVTIQQFRMQER